MSTATVYSILIIEYSCKLPSNRDTITIRCFVFPQRVVRFCELIFTGQVNGAAIVTSVITIFILISLDYANKYLRKYVKKIPIHIPAQLIVVSLCSFTC